MRVYLLCPDLIQQTDRCPTHILEINSRIDRQQILRKCAEDKKQVVAPIRRYPWNTRIDHDGCMVSQSRSESGTGTGRVNRRRHHLGRIDLANQVLKLEMRTPEKGFPDNISKRENEYTRLFRLCIHYTTIRFLRNCQTATVPLRKARRSRQSTSGARDPLHRFDSDVERSPDPPSAGSPRCSHTFDSPP